MRAPEIDLRLVRGLCRGGFERNYASLRGSYVVVKVSDSKRGGELLWHHSDDPNRKVERVSLKIRVLGRWKMNREIKSTEAVKFSRRKLRERREEKRGVAISPLVWSSVVWWRYCFVQRPMGLWEFVEKESQSDILVPFTCFVVQWIPGTCMLPPRQRLRHVPTTSTAPFCFCTCFFYIEK